MSMNSISLLFPVCLLLSFFLVTYAFTGCQSSMDETNQNTENNETYLDESEDGPVGTGFIGVPKPKPTPKSCEQGMVPIPLPNGVVICRPGSSRG